MAAAADAEARLTMRLESKIYFFGKNLIDSNNLVSPKYHFERTVKPLLTKKQQLPVSNNQPDPQAFQINTSFTGAYE
jgi:hypothetical protein